MAVAVAKPIPKPPLSLSSRDVGLNSGLVREQDREEVVVMIRERLARRLRSAW